MTIDHPTELAGLRRLWQEAFGDSDAFLDIFFTQGFDPARSLCISENDTPVAALYWFDCSCNGRKIAYLYAVATARSHRGQGLCRRLMADTHKILANQGYSSAVLVPGEPSLFDFYEKMGYQTICCTKAIACTAGDKSLPVATLSTDAYAAQRRRLLPDNAVVQEGDNLAFLSQICGLYGGDGWVMAASTEGKTLWAMEFLGDTALLPGILTALGASEGHIRTPGDDAFAMYLPFDTAEPPAYFGIPFD